MKHYGLVGHPLTHSFSKRYFTEKFEREGLDCDYQNYDLPSLQALADPSNLNGLSGFNVTIPYKEAILPYLDELDPVAAAVGAVNTVKVSHDRKMKGYNTDVVGFDMLLSSLREGHHPSNPKALILGTGGASKAVQYALSKHQLPYHLVSRTSEKGHFTYEELTPEVIKVHLLIINATPMGMAPHIEEAPAIPYEALNEQHVLIDLIYNPEETIFLHKGKEKGAIAINGLKMLHTQAEASWNIWNK